MKEQIVSFETAKLAKEKGFDVLTKCAYWKNFENNYFIEEVADMQNSELATHNFSAPTQSLLQKWLREKYKFHIMISDCANFMGIYGWVAYLSIINTHTILFKTTDPLSNDYKSEDKKLICTSYEMALELALLEALKLI